MTKMSTKTTVMKTKNDKNKKKKWKDNKRSSSRNNNSDNNFSKMKKIVEQKNEAVMFKVRFSSVTHLDFFNFKVLNFGFYVSLNF